MKTVTATAAQNNFGALLLEVQSGPVAITRNGKTAGVVLSAKDYEEIKRLALRQALIVGEESGRAGQLDMAEIKKKARRRAGLNA